MMTPAMQKANEVTAPVALKNSGRKIVFTLYTCMLPESAFKETPSQADGFDIETETDLRILGCEMIQTAGILLKLPQAAMVTGQIYLQRFYYYKSFLRYPMETMAMGSIYLASKVEEKPCRIQDVINVFHHIKQVRAQKTISPLILDQNYIELKNQVIIAERRILKELGFCVHVRHPHKLALVYLQLLQYEKNRQLMQMTWNYINDALRTDVFMRFPPETIACACIYLAARKINLPLPNSPHWFHLFKVTEEDIKKVCRRILELYKRSKVNPEVLENKVDCLRRIHQANKHLQAQKQQENAKSEQKKKESPTVSTSKDTSKIDNKNEKCSREVCRRNFQLYKNAKVNPEEFQIKVDGQHRVYQANKHLQALKEQKNAKTEKKKIESSTGSTLKDTSRRNSKKEESPKTPPLSSMYYSSHKSKKERRSRSPYDRKKEYSSKRRETHSGHRDLYRSRRKNKMTRETVE